MSNDALSGWINPFHVQWMERYFVGRQDELRVFNINLQALKQGQQSHLLVAGVHGTGKTFYLNKLVEIAKSNNCIGVLADCPESQPLEQASSILLQTIKELQTQITPNGSPPSMELSADFDKKDKSTLFSFPKRDYLAESDLKDDFGFLAKRAKAAGRNGIVICIDEGQRSTRVLLSALKNALSKVEGILIVLSWRLSSDAKGAVAQAREELVRRMVDTEGDKDIGAASFFSSQTAMGPFKTDEEVEAYFRARLTGNTIRFSPEISSHFGEIANKVPRPMTDLAHDVYDAALRENLTDVNLPLLDKCFRDRYTGEVKRAIDLCSDLSPETMTVLKALCQHPDFATPLDLAKDAFSGMPTSVAVSFVSSQLDKLCQSSSILQKTDDKYSIVDSFSRYALKMALGLA